MSYTYNQIEWLQNILRERLSPYLSLRVYRKGWAIINLQYSDKRILIKLDPDTFRKADEVLVMGSWAPKPEGWPASPLGDDLPSPGFAKEKGHLILEIKDGYLLKYDILGLIFWSFTRLEETTQRDVDDHDRFSAYSSHAFKNGYLERPIVDEWLMLLGHIMKRLWPSHNPIKREFQIKLSHDVDIVSRYRFTNPYSFARRIVIDTLKYRDLRSAFLGSWGFLLKSNKLSTYDRFNTFDWIMKQSEARGLSSSFYFLCGCTNPDYDAEYNIEHPIIRDLLCLIHSRGHSIGLHPSYNSYTDIDAICTEAAKLRQICAEEKIKQDTWGGRMHFLRWRHPVTMYGWEKANMHYDSTMGYAEQAGFRCGTCHEYSAFDPLGDRTLKLRIRPLIAMEHTVISKNYMGLGLGEQAFNKFIQLKDTCKIVSGTFALLWHNNQLATRAERELYSSIIN